MLSGERMPSASFRSRSLAAARNPIRTSGLANFSHAALLVTVMSQISGTAVTQAYFNLFDSTDCQENFSVMARSRRVLSAESFDPDPYLAILDRDGIHHATIDIEPGAAFA